MATGHKPNREPFQKGIAFSTQCAAMADAVHCEDGCSALQERLQCTASEMGKTGIVIASPVLDKRKGRKRLTPYTGQCSRPQEISAEPIRPVIIISPVLMRNRYLTSRTPLTCSGMTDNHIRRQGISCTLLPGKRVNLTTGSKSKPDGRLTMWGKEIMTSSRKEDFV